MIPRPLLSLCLCLLALMAVSIDQCSCHKSISRGASHHRFTRRSSLTLSNLRRRSYPPSTTTSPMASPNHSRRSIDLDQLENDYASQSLDQQRDQAEKMWEQFVESTDGEDPDLYPDCEDEGQNTSDTFSLGANDIQSVEPLSSSGSSTSASQEAKPTPKFNSQKQQPSKDQSTGSNHHETQVQSGDTGNETQDAPQKKEDEKVRKAKEDADAQAQRDKEAAYKKQQEQDATQAKKEREEADAKKAQADADAKAKADADAKAKADADAQAQKDKAEQDKEAYQVTNLKKIPGTSVTTGTATRPKDETYATPATSDQHKGDATFFDPDTGACGIRNYPSDYIVAVSHLLYDSYPSHDGNPNTNTICGKKIRASYKGKSVEVTVTDRCEGCDMFSLDFTETAFEKLAPKDLGRLHDMTWTFI